MAVTRPSMAQILFASVIKMFFLSPSGTYSILRLFQLFMTVLWPQTYADRSHFKKWMARHRKYIKSAPPTLWNTKYKCKSRCDKKNSEYFRCRFSGFLPLRTPYHLQRWSFSSTPPHVSFTEGEEGCCSLFQRKPIWTCQNRRKRCPLSSVGAVGTNEGNRVAYLSLASGTSAQRTSILIQNQAAFLIVPTACVDAPFQIHSQTWSTVKHNCCPVAFMLMRLCVNSEMSRGQWRFSCSPSKPSWLLFSVALVTFSRSPSASLQGFYKWPAHIYRESPAKGWFWPSLTSREDDLACRWSAPLWDRWPTACPPTQANLSDFRGFSSK